MANASSEGRLPSGAQMLSVQVVACAPAARDAITLLLAVPGTQQAPAPYLPGQFITLAFPTAQKVIYRSYSLCGDGRPDAPWEITIKRHHEGLVSNYLFSHARPGLRLWASHPQGKFTLPAAIRPGMSIVFVAGGSGITPIYGMLRALARLAPARRPQVWLHYAYHSPEDAIYARELAALDPQRYWLNQWHYVAAHGSRLRVEEVVTSLGAEAPRAEWYVCGPAGLKRSLQSVAVFRGVPAERIHAEVFSSPPDRAVVPTASAPARVRLAESGAVLDVRAGETLLETLERHGYRPDSDCRAGACGTCRLRVLAGQVRNGDGSGLTPGERAQGYALACIGQPVGDVTVAAAGVPTAGRTGRVGAAAPGRRSSARKALRVGLTAAAASVFFTAWGLTSHAPSTHTSSAAPSLPSITLPSFGGDDGGNANGNGDDGGGFFGQSPSGPSSINTQPGPLVPNTSSGVS